MESRQHRLLYLVVIVAGFVFGVGLEPVLDPLERQNLAWIGLVAAMLVGGVAACYWYKRKARSIGGPDERLQRIELRASRRSQRTLVAGVAVLALIAVLPWAELPVAVLLGALLVAGIAVHELSIEYDRRRM